MTKIILMALAGLLLTLAAFLFAGGNAQASHDANANDFYWMSYYNDHWFNWDFEETWSTDGRTHVDWPVNLLFVNSATINKVKNAYLGLSDSHGQIWFQNKPFPPGGTCGSTKYMWLDDAASTTGAHWDQDDGIKGGYLNGSSYDCVPGGGEWSVHFRLYADNPNEGGNDKMGYNTQWGYWVMATSHFDYDECNWNDPFCNPLYGWTETAEAYIGWDGVDLWGSGAVTWNKWGLFNDQNWPDGQWAGEHYVYNNGWATEVRVP